MKMQQTEQEFDLFVRSMMDNAQEEVPSRVWERCVQELDRRQKPVVLWWRRAAVSVAAAAAVAALVVTGIRLAAPADQDNRIAVVSEPEGVVEDIQTAEPEAVSGLTETTDNPMSQDIIPQDVSRMAASVQRPVSQRVTASEQETSAPEKAMTEAATSSDEAPVSTVPAEASPEEPVATVPAEEILPSPDERTASAPDDEVDPFAQMEWEDSQVSEAGFDISAGGEMMSNGNPKASGGFDVRRAASTAPKQTRIDQTSQNSTYAVPVTLGLNVRYHFNRRWSLGTGVNWSMLERTFTGNYYEVEGDKIVRTESSDIHNTLHYIGIPLNAYFNILYNPRTSLYAYVGGAAEKGIISRYRLATTHELLNYSQSISGVQLSVAVGLGVQFNVTPWLGIYIDPSLRYYFDCSQPVSIRTQQPLMMGFEAGVRFNL
ncbi:MAG: outer membrane beta-barrel protein [Bacteroidales bacterium]|nr:outer membrane beta-barrel protein [Bacteroidales bacterium]